MASYSVFDRLLGVRPYSEDEDPNDPFRKFFGGGLPSPSPKPSPSPTKPVSYTGTPTSGTEVIPSQAQFSQQGLTQQDPVQAALAQAITKLITPTGGRHLGIGGQEITSDNPSGNTINPWAGQPFGFQHQMTPEATLASQGGSAMNQWAQRGGVQGVDPNLLKQLMAPKRKEDRTTYDY